jgi:biotin synthase-related radical SAM superfamily protein
MKDGKQPPLDSYRRMQLARQLIEDKLVTADKMTFKKGKLAGYGLPEKVVREQIKKGKAFITSGCPGCNRPFANETPTQAQQGLLRNYPFAPNKNDIDTIEGQF